MTAHCDLPGPQPCPPHLLLYTTNTVDKYRQVYCSEAAEQINSFPKVFYGGQDFLWVSI